MWSVYDVGVEGALERRVAAALLVDVVAVVVAKHRNGLQTVTAWRSASASPNICDPSPEPPSHCMMKRCCSHISSRFCSRSKSSKDACSFLLNGSWRRATHSEPLDCRYHAHRPAHISLLHRVLYCSSSAWFVHRAMSTRDEQLRQVRS